VVAILAEAHEHHTASLALLAGPTPARFAVSAHSYAEAYSTLTRGGERAPFGFSAGEAWAALARIIHEKCAIKAKPLISLTTMRMGCLMKFFAMKFLAQVFGGLGRFRAVR